jgi:L-ascorbate metabolism protein UlaG (beta-lactamase superfamily)
MVINWYGEGCFKLQTVGITILIDPFDKSVGLTPPRFKSDILLKTLNEYPIDYKEASSASIFGPGEYEIKEVEILGWQVSENEKSIKTVYLIKSEGLNVGILGSLTDDLDVSVIDKLSGVEILFVPAGGNPHISQQAVAKLIKQISPKIVVTSFFKIPGLKTKSGDVKDFLKELNYKAETQENQNRNSDFKGLSKPMMNFIRKIQDSDEKTRKRWLIGFSSVTMITVIGLWLVYMNVIVEPIDSPENIAQLVQKEEVNEDPGFAEIFGAGFDTITSKLKETVGGALGYIGNQFGTSNEIKIDNSNRNFILDSLDKIPTTPLP